MRAHSQNTLTHRYSPPPKDFPNFAGTEEEEEAEEEEGGMVLTTVAVGGWWWGGWEEGGAPVLAVLCALVEEWDLDLSGFG